MEVYLDSMPMCETEYLVFKKNLGDNTCSLIGCDYPAEMDYCGIKDIRDLVVGSPEIIVDEDEGEKTEYEVIRLK